MSDTKFFAIDAEGTILVCATREQAEADENAQVFSTEGELAALVAKWPAQKALEIHNALPLKSVLGFDDPQDAVSAIWKEVSKLPTPRALGSKSTIHKEPVMKKKSAVKPKAAPEPKAAPAPKKSKAVRKAERAAVKALKKEAAAQARAQAKVDAKAKKAEAKAAKKAAKVAKPKKAAKGKTPKAPRKPRDPNAPKSKKAANGEGIVKASTKPPREGSKIALVLEITSKAKGATLEELMKATGWQAHTTRGFMSTLDRKYPDYVVTSEKDKDGLRRYKSTEK
jgi:type IV secretory pathway VirB10-like protein